MTLVTIGQYTGLRRFFSNPLVGIVGSIASVVSLILAVIFYIESQRYPELVYVVHPVPVVLAQPGGPLKVEFKGQPLDVEIVAVQIAMWNQGRAPIRSEHLLAPLEIRLHPPVAVLEATVSKQSREIVRLQVQDRPDIFRESRVPIAFRILEQGDGGTIQVVYAGIRGSEPELVGVIEGQPAPRRLGSRPKPPPSPQQYVEREKRRITYVLGLGALALILTAVLTSSAYYEIRRAPPGEASSAQFRLYQGIGMFIVTAVMLGAVYVFFREPTPPFGF